MVYCDQDMCESKLGRLMQAFRADRPSEWQMDEFIGMAEKMHEMNKELLMALEVIASSKPILMHDEGQREVVVYNLEFNPAKIAREAISKAKGIA